MNKYAVFILSLLISFAAVAQDSPAKEQVFRGTLIRRLSNTGLGPVQDYFLLKADDGKHYRLRFGDNDIIPDDVSKLDGKKVEVTGKIIAENPMVTVQVSSVKGQ